MLMTDGGRGVDLTTPPSSFSSETSPRLCGFGGAKQTCFCYKDARHDVIAGSRFLELQLVDDLDCRCGIVIRSQTTDQRQHLMAPRLEKQYHLS